MARSKKAVSPQKPVPAVKTARKKRVGNVRGLILKSLASGPKTRAALQKSSNASYNALVMHLTRLREEGVVETDASNRLISLTAAGSAAQAGAAPKARASTRSAAPSTTLPQLARETPLVAGYSPRALNEALDALAARFKPIPALDEKVLVLDQLAEQIGGPVGHVLGSIKTDLLRLSAGGEAVTGR